ncbi:MAG: hypothetical protein RR840_04560 [Clostridium sp.]
MEIDKYIKLGVIGLIGVLSIHIMDLIFLFSITDNNIALMSFLHLIFYIMVFISGYSLCRYTSQTIEGNIVSILATFCCIISIYIDILYIIRIKFPLVSSYFTTTKFSFSMIIFMHILLLSSMFLVIFFKSTPKIRTLTHMSLLILLSIKSIFLTLISITPNIENETIMLIRVISNSIDCIILTLVTITFKSFIKALIKTKSPDNSSLNIKDMA